MLPLWVLRRILFDPLILILCLFALPFSEIAAVALKEDVSLQ